VAADPATAPDGLDLDVVALRKRYGAFTAVDDLSFGVRRGSFFSILGPSGCGKTTLLRVIAGLETPDAGSILFSGEDATDVHVRDRNVGFVFQHYALFRHMTVADNVAFGLRVKPRGERPSEAQIKQKVMDLLKLVQLDWLAERYPSQLSGGQRQRIALARAAGLGLCRAPGGGGAGQRGLATLAGSGEGAGTGRT